MYDGDRLRTFISTTMDVSPDELPLLYTWVGGPSAPFPHPTIGLSFSFKMLLQYPSELGF